MDDPDRRSARAAGLRAERLRARGPRRARRTRRVCRWSSCRGAGPPSRRRRPRVLAGRHAAAPAALDLPRLARLLHLSAGVVRVAERTDRPDPAVARGRLGRRALPARGLRLRPRRGRAAGRRALVRPGRACAAAGRAARRRRGDDARRHRRPWRTGWRYAERGFRHIYWDAGTMLAQALALAESAGLGPRLWTRFPDAAARRGWSAPTACTSSRSRSSASDRGEPAIAPAGEAATRRRRRRAARVPARHAGAARGRRRRARRPVAGGRRRSKRSRRRRPTSTR